MRIQNLPAFLACLLFSFALTGCGSPIAKVYRQEAVPASFATVFQNPDNFKGDTVVWGGEIIRTIPSKKGASIYILETELGLRDKPKASETSQGRFIARTNLFLDPLIYSSGRKITLAGKVIGKDVKTSSKTGTTYTYPVIQMEQSHLWPLPEAMAPPGYWWGWGQGDSLYWGGPYWGDEDEGEGFIDEGDEGGAGEAGEAGER